MLSIVATRNGAALKGRWLRLAWSQSLAGQPVRLLARLVRESETEEHPLAAAVPGRCAWTWLAPHDLVRLDILAPAESAAAIRIDTLESVSSARLAAALLRRRPAALLPLLWRSGRPRSRSVAIHEALDLAELADFARLSAARRRPFEPNGLEAGLEAAAAMGPRIGFVLRLERREQLPALRLTLAALAAQIDRGFAVRLMAPQELAEQIGDEELGDRGEPSTFLAPLCPGDEPYPEAVLLLRAHLAARPELDALYADSALRTPTGLEAQLKPDWSPLFQVGTDYIGRPCLVRASLAEPDVPWRDLAGRIAAARGDRSIGHLKRVLLTLAASAPSSVIPGARAARVFPSCALRERPKSETSDLGAGGKGIQEGSHAALDPLPLRCAPAGDDAGDGAARATLVVPTRDRADLLGRLVASLARLPAGDHDLVVVDNGSEDPEALALLATLETRSDTTVLRRPGPFNFPALVNAGVAAASGPVVVLLNNDCEIVESDAIDRLARLAMRPGIGAVGARLLYPDGTVQHAGVALGLGGEAGHRDRGRAADHPGSLGRLRVAHEVSAVTAACLAVRRDLFEEAGGFDEALPVAFNDIDFCLRLAALGHRTILDPCAVLIHAESASRGRDDGPRRAGFLAEAALFRERWKEKILDDPFFHPMLTAFRFRDLLG